MIKYFILLLFLSLAACSSTTNHDGPPANKIDFSKIPNAVPKILPLSKLGNPPYYNVMGHRYYIKKSSKGFDKRGIASWYGTKFNGHRTSNGERYNLFGMTAAMRTIPIPTFVEVTNLKNNKDVIVKVNDRGPFKENRIIDLSYTAAAKLGMLEHGTALVEVRAIDPTTWHKRHMKNKPKLQHLNNPQLFIQVGAFSDLAKAQKIQDALQQSISEKNRIEPIPHGASSIYRVQLGPIASVDDSDMIMQQLKDIGFAHAITVIE